MKRPETPGLINLIGIVLVTVALVSAGGLFYIASEYSKISDAYVSSGAGISEIKLTQSNISGDVTVSIMVLLDNPSSLDIEIYRIECYIHMDSSETTITHSDRYVGSGSIGDRNGTVQADSLREFQVNHLIRPDDTIYMERFERSLDGSLDLFADVQGFVWFRIADYPDVTNKLPITYRGQEVIQIV